MEVIVAVFIQRLCVSLLIIFLFVGLVERIFGEEHERFLETEVYTERTFAERMFYILEHGRFLHRVVLGVSAVGLYHGAEFLSEDILFILAFFL